MHLGACCPTLLAALHCLLPYIGPVGSTSKAAQSETEEEDDNSVAHGDLSQAEDTLEESDEKSESPTD